MDIQNLMPFGQRYKQLALKSLPWVLSALLLFILLSLMLSLQNVIKPDEDSVIVRKVDIALPPPPPPPPPLETEPLETESETPTINLIGLGDGPSMRYSDTPVLGKINIEQVKKPEFDLSSLNLEKAISLEFPVVGVQSLDRLPRVVSVRNPQIPKVLRDRGIRSVPVKVDIIITDTGKAYVKKIVNPVYPEMVKPIRQWVSSVRFTVPTKNGKPVQAIYHYTLNFKYRT